MKPTIFWRWKRMSNTTICPSLVKTNKNKSTWRRTKDNKCSIVLPGESADKSLYRRDAVNYICYLWHWVSDLLTQAIPEYPVGKINSSEINKSSDKVRYLYSTRFQVFSFLLDGKMMLKNGCCYTTKGGWFFAIVSFRIRIKGRRKPEKKEIGVLQ